MNPRALVLTSGSIRHQFVVHALAPLLDVVGVWQEEKRFAPLEIAGSADDRAVIASHFAARDASERTHFAGHETLTLAPTAVHRRIGPGGCNDPGELETMQALKPEVVLVFGTELLRGPVLAAFGRLINLHLGLSPYYRGAGTNFWPLVNGEPEYVGATIHYLDAGLDSGPIIAHVRPAIEPGDGPHDIGNKTIAAAGPVLAAIARAHAQAPLPAVPQQGDGRLYFRRHFSADAVRRLVSNFESGMVAEYLANRAARDAAVGLVACPLPREPLHSLTRA